MDQPGSSSTNNPNMGWMYEGTKSLVNREDYLLGKKIDKNFELYSDVVIKDNEEEKRDEFFKRALLQPASGRTAANHKISALDTRIVRNEDPLVALKFQEEQRKRQLLENPLLKLKAHRVLRKALEKELKKEMKKKKNRATPERREERTSTSRKEIKQKSATPERREERTSRKEMKRPKLTPKEMEERRKAMMVNASWRDEQREKNIKITSEQLRKEEASNTGNVPTFIKPLLSSETTSSLEKRLQSNRHNIQRSHEHMEKSFARK